VLAALGLIAAVILVIIGAWILLMGWPLLVAAIIFIIFAVIIGTLVIGVLVFIAAIPLFFIKSPETQNGSYSIEDVRPIREEEKK
jgi:hypothetical protein